MQRLGAVMSRPYRKIPVCQNGCHIMRMHPFHAEGEDAVMAFRILCPQQLYMRDLTDEAVSQTGQFLFSFHDPVHPHGFQIVDGRCQPYGTSCIYGSCLEFMRKLCVGYPGERYGLDHLSSCQEWRHPVQQLFLPVQNADPHGGKHFMSGKCQKIHIQFLNIRASVRHTLCTVRHIICTILMCDSRQSLHIIHLPEDI